MLRVQFHTLVGGMFMERWAVSTLPRAGPESTVVLCGIAAHDTTHSTARVELESELEAKVMRRAIADMISSLVARVHPRNHEAIFGAEPPTLEQRFLEVNAELVNREGWTYVFPLCIPLFCMVSCCSLLPFYIYRGIYFHGSF